MKFLSALNVQQKNKGVSTGTKWLASKGATIESYSPVNGKLIGAVSSADKNSYEAVMATAQSVCRMAYLAGTKAWRNSKADR